MGVQEWVSERTVMQEGGNTGRTRGGTPWRRDLAGSTAS